jgi:ABC-2 type transport system ATP-binding protein
MTVVPFSKLLLVALLGATLGLAACGSDDTPAGVAGPNNPTNPNEEVEQAVVVLVNANNPDFEGAPRDFTAPACSASSEEPREGGGIYSVNLQSASGHNIAFTVFEPAEFNCERGNPLVLEGHGYGGSRASSPRGIMGDLIEAGAGVISIDQRGFGESGGSVRVLFSSCS